MQREEAPTITSLPLELLAAIFDQLVSSTTTSTTEDVECYDRAGGGLDLPENGYTKGTSWDVMGEDSACTEDEEEDEADRGSGGNESKENSRLAPSAASRPSMEAVEAVLVASAVCSGWREVIIKENALWKRLTLARWRVWQDLTWRTRRGTNWRAVHFQRVRRDKEVPGLLALLARTTTHRDALQRLQELGMDVWEKLTALIARWQRRPLQYLGLLHNATICMQALTEMRIKKEWKKILGALSRDDRMLSGSDSDDQRDEMEESSSSSSGSSCTSSSSSSGGSGGEPPEEEEDDEGDSERRRKRNGSVKREIDIEEGAVLIASWEHTTDLNVRRKVYRELDEIAGTVRQRLAQSAAVDGEEGTAVVARGKEIEGVDEGRILSEVNTTLYDYLGFTGNVNDYMNPNNSLIDQVLEKRMGIPITLALVYAAVCRRLGIRIDMIGMPGHFMVKYTNPAGGEIFIDAFAEGRHLTPDDCREMLAAMGMTFFTPDLLRPVGHIVVYERMLANLLGVYQRLRQTDKLLGVAKQLLILRGENSAEDLLTCGRLHMLLDQFIEARPLIQRVLDTSTNVEHVEQARTLMAALEGQLTAQEATPPKRRPAEPEKLRFRVGQVINHIRHAYRGVIYGWDTVCSATSAWIREMRVDDLPRGRNQPFYSVLVDLRDKPGNWTTYVAQENIELPEEARPVEHAQVGAFFTRFDEQARRFVPNPELRARYPEDCDGGEECAQEEDVNGDVATTVEMAPPPSPPAGANMMSSSSTMDE